MKTEYTHRGFALIQFEDRYGATCTIQKSSMISPEAIWFGVENADPKIMAADAEKFGIVDPGDGTGWIEYPIPREVLINTRMHLTQDQVIDLLPILQHFAETGELPEIE